MAKAIAVFIAACFAFVSLMGFWFYIAVGQSHGPGLEIAIVAGVLAVIAGVAGAWLAARDPN
jgi:uncharacterized membrane protein HdeD (DUF308 family)